MKIPQRSSVVKEVVDSLRDAIRSGEFREHLPGVRKLSCDLHVSIPTILGAVHALEAEGVLRSKPGMRTAIISPKSGVRQKKSNPHRVIILSFGTKWISGSLYYQAVLDELRELGFSLRICECERLTPVAILQNLEELVSHERADCWVLLGAPAEVQVFFAERHLPCLLDGVAAEGLALHDFQVDYAALFRHAINHLRNKGHSRICLVTTKHSAQINPETIKVFRETVKEGAPELAAWEPIRTHDGSIDHFKMLLNSLFFGGTPAPTALIIVTVRRVAAAMTWLMKHGLRIPEDVSIISRDHDDEMLEFLHPLPAHYRQPPSASKRFVRAILAIIDKKHTRRHTRIMTEFVRGETTHAI